MSDKLSSNNFPYHMHHKLLIQTLCTRIAEKYHVQNHSIHINGVCWRICCIRRSLATLKSINLSRIIGCNPLELIACDFFCPCNIQSGVNCKCGILFQKLSLHTRRIRTENKCINDVFNGTCRLTLSHEDSNFLHEWIKCLIRLLL